LHLIFGLALEHLQGFGDRSELVGLVVEKDGIFPV